VPSLDRAWRILCALTTHKPARDHYHADRGLEFFPANEVTPGSLLSAQSTHINHTPNSRCGTCSFFVDTAKMRNLQVHFRLRPEVRFLLEQFIFVSSTDLPAGMLTLDLATPAYFTRLLPAPLTSVPPVYKFAQACPGVCLRNDLRLVQIAWNAVCCRIITTS
jgi:hypothetical protein